jgi:hypothetical protein
MNNISPLIWRRLITESATSLFELHNYIQLMFPNWRNYHLYRFEKGGVEFADPRLWEDFDMIDVKVVHICHLLKEEGHTLNYFYDPGDGWEMTIRLEAISIEREGKYRRPVCLDGENSAPPEDVGGEQGFAEFLSVYNDQHHPEYSQVRTWAGRSYDPWKFDLKKVNILLGKRKNYIFEYNMGIDVPGYIPQIY